jgi:uncharacterized membrane protein YhhN
MNNKKQVAQCVCVLSAASYIGWSHAHTDEIPVVLGFVLILSATLGGVFPGRPWITGFLLGAPVFLVETLVHYSVIRAPYPPSAGLPWPALLAFIPAMGGAFFGSAVRHLNKKANPAG